MCRRMGDKSVLNERGMDHNSRTVKSKPMRGFGALRTSAPSALISQGRGGTACRYHAMRKLFSLIADIARPEVLNPVAEPASGCSIRINPTARPYYL
jgi:hypothetical protein